MFKSQLRHIIKESIKEILEAEELDSFPFKDAIENNKYITIDYSSPLRNTGNLKLKDLKNIGDYVQASDIKIVDKKTGKEDPKDNNSKNKPFANPDNAKNIPDEIKDIRGKIYEGNLVSTNDNNLTSSKNKTITLQGLEAPTTVNQSGRKFIIQTPENKAIIAEFKEAKTS